jgi:hypothetical protein
MSFNAYKQGALIATANQHPQQMLRQHKHYQLPLCLLPPWLRALVLVALCSSGSRLLKASLIGAESQDSASYLCCRHIPISSHYMPAGCRPTNNRVDIGRPKAKWFGRLFGRSATKKNDVKLVKSIEMTEDIYEYLTMSPITTYSRYKCHKSRGKILSSILYFIWPQM